MGHSSGRRWRGALLFCLGLASAVLSLPALAQVRHEGAVPDGGGGIPVLTNGLDHACGILSTGRVMCWGIDAYGKATPPSGDFIEVSAGFQHTCGLRGDGTVACWGEGFTPQSPDIPATPVPEGRFTTLASGIGFTCGLRVRIHPWDYPGGNVECWSGSPWGAPPSPPPGEFIALSAADHQVCGLRADGEAQCWGGYAAPGPEGRFIAVSAGVRHACGLRADGTVDCWGDSPEGATPPAELFTAISAGFEHTCGLRPNGQAQCWGANWAGQADAPAEERFVAISAGLHSTCGVRTDGQVRCWGNAESGIPMPDERHRFGYGSVASGAWHGCQAGAEGQVGCWGNMQPQPGLPEQRYRDIDGSEGVSCAKDENGVLACFGWENEIAMERPQEPVRQFALGHRHACAVLGLDGHARCWGWDSNGQNQAPEDVFRNVSAGLVHSCGVNDAGYGGCWGYNGDGQNDAPPLPPEVRYLTIRAGDRHSCALTSDLHVRCWGQIESLPPPDPQDPETDPWFATFRAVATGANHACAVRTNGRVVCWGANWSGQSQPPAGTFASLSAGTDLTCGIRSDGSRECWGAPYLVPRLRLDPEFLPSLRPGQWMSQSLWLQNESQSYALAGPVRFHVAAGVLPESFHLDEEAGYLFGALFEPGAHPITLEGRDRNGFAARRDYVLSIDETPPVIEPLIQGTAGENGWYTSPVELAWSVTDPESQILNQHCFPESLGVETPEHRVLCAAESGGGWADREVILKLDFTPPPPTMIFPAPAGGGIELKFEGEDALSGVGRFECSLDGAAYVACPSPYQVTAGAGEHWLDVRTIDVAGNAGEPGRFKWTGDATPPQIAEVLSGPLGSNGWYVGNVGINWNVQDPESPISSAVGCNTSTLASDSPGAGYTCTATSLGGTSSRSVTVKRDTVAPQTSFSGALPGNTTQRSAVFHFTGTDATSGVDFFECRINTGAYYPCATGQTHTVSPGTVTFAVRAVDRAGRRDATPAQHAWVVDDTPPQIVSTVNGTLGQNGWYVAPVDLSWAVTDAQSSVTSTGCNAVSLTSDVLAAEFICTATSVGGTSSRTVVVKLDRVAPDTQITQAPPAQTGAAQATFEFGGSDGTSGVRFYECSLDGGPFDLCTSPRTVSVSAQGTHTFQVRSMDYAGHRDASPASAEWVVDLTPPDIGLDVTGERAPSGWYVGDVQVDWSVSEPTSTATSQGCDDLLLDTDTAGIDLTCAASSAGGSASRSVTLRRDSVAPQTALTQAPRPETDEQGATFEFGGSDATSGVLGFECNLDDQGYVPCASPYTLTGLPAGAHRMQVRAFDAAGHRDATPELHAWTIDTTPPEIQPTVYATQGNNGWLVSDVRIEWAVSDTGSAVATSGCNTATVTSDTSGTRFTCTATSAGGSSSRTVTVKRDATAPVVTAAPSTAPNANGWYRGDVQVAFGCVDLTSGLAAGGCAGEQTITGEGAGLGSMPLTVFDEAGNRGTSAVVTVNIDRTAPTLSPTVPANLLLNAAASATANGGDGLSGVATQSCTALVTSSVGTRTTSCTVADRAGNLASATASYRVDYGFNGFTSPVQNPPVLNLLKAGRAVPLRWRVVDANGAPVTNLASASVTPVAIACPSASQNRISTFGGSSTALKNLGNGYYQLDWTAASSLRGLCRRLDLNLGDGQVRSAQFKFD